MGHESKRYKRRYGMIRVEDIAAMRQEMYIGKVLEDTVYYDRLGERLAIPKRKKIVVTGIYPYLVQVRRKGQPETLPIQTITYVELLQRRVQEEKEGEKDNV